MGAAPASGLRAFQAPPDSLKNVVDTAVDLVVEGASQLLLEPALFTADILTALATATSAPVLPFSVSGEFNALPLSLQIEMFTALKRAGAARIVTYAAADIAAQTRTALL